jgi:hypothetical protein
MGEPSTPLVTGWEIAGSTRSMPSICLVFRKCVLSSGSPNSRNRSRTPSRLLSCCRQEWMQRMRARSQSIAVRGSKIQSEPARLRSRSAWRSCSLRSAVSARALHAASDRRQRSRTCSSVAPSASAPACAARARKNSRFEVRTTGSGKAIWLRRSGRPDQHHLPA